MTSDPIVTVRHMREARLCAGGSRRWFQEVGFDWNDFLTNGIPASKLRTGGNALVERAIEIAEREGAAHGE